MTDATDLTGTRATARVPVVLDLDDPRCLDPAVSGGKAAALAAARRHRLPALPGVVVPAAATAPALAAGASVVETRGSGGARLAVMAFDPGDELVAAVTAAVADLPDPFIVRSSARVEADGRWAGAFGSVAGVGRQDLRTGLLACWASVFAPDTLERLEAEDLTAPDIGFAALVQPEIAPEYGGTARLRGGGAVAINATSGSPAPLVAGWVAGAEATVAVDGTVQGEEAVALAGLEVLRGVAAMVTDTAAALGDTAVEWAWHDGRPVLLQSHAGRAAEAEPAAPTTEDDPTFASPHALAVGALVRRFGSALDEELVLPWALSDPTREWATSNRSGKDSSGSEPLALEQARSLAAELAAPAWGVAPHEVEDTVKQTLRALRGTRPAKALERIAQLEPVRDADPLAARLVATAAAERSGPVRGPGRWEPFLHAVVTAHGQRVQGTSAAVGVSAGPVVAVIDPHDPPVVPPRSVILAPRPVQALAPLLWQAAAIVTTSGGAGAHLFEVAESLGVAAVIAPQLRGILEQAVVVPVGDILAAVDGGAGTVVTAPVHGGVPAIAGRRPS